MIRYDPYTLHLLWIFNLALQVNVSNIYEVMMITIIPGDNANIYTWSQP